eukprot:2942378-Karenia_brevis.AAC.1
MMQMTQLLVAQQAQQQQQQTVPVAQAAQGVATPAEVKIIKDEVKKLHPAISAEMKKLGAKHVKTMLKVAKTSRRIEEVKSDLEKLDNENTAHK